MGCRDFLLQRVAKQELSPVFATIRLKAIKKVFRFFKKKEIFINPDAEMKLRLARVQDRLYFPSDKSER